VNVGRGPRSIPATANERLRLFEATLEDEGRADRDRLRAKYAERDRLTEERRVILNRENQYLREAQGSILMSNGDAFIAGSVTLLNSGIQFMTKRGKQLIAPYASVHGLMEDESGHAVATIGDDFYVSFSVEAGATRQISEWIGDIKN
jgi:hypothetical protein